MPAQQTPLTDEAVVQLVSQAGVKRDGTQFDGNFYSDATWCRWQRNRPRKIGGYRVNDPYLNGVMRALNSQLQNGNQYWQGGHAAGIDHWVVDTSGIGSLTTARTLPGFTTNANTRWTFDVQYDNTAAQTLLFAHPNAGLLTPSDNTGFPIYYGNVYDATAMTAVTMGGTTVLPAGGISGGVCSLAPFMTAFGADGYWASATSGFPTDFTNAAGKGIATRITSQKIIRGIPLRAGGGYSPAGLYWSLDALTRAMFIGGTGTPAWQFDQLSTDISVLSPACIIEHDGVFYWAAADRFMIFNGVVQELPNNMNLNWFFDGINATNAAKSFAFKNPRWGEIWWCYPRDGATECSHAVIYNYREKTWYDTPLPNSGRSAGAYGNAPVGVQLAGVDVNATSQYNMWQHETGVDEINGGNTYAVKSSFTTAGLSSLNQPVSTGQELSLQAVEADLVQSGDLTLTVYTQANVKAPIVAAATATVFATPPTPQDQITWAKTRGRIIYLQFTSNSQGGNYQMGKTVLHLNSHAGERVT